MVDKFLLEIETQLHMKKVEATFTEELKEFLAKKGSDPKMGARPMSRLIQNTVRKALADELFFGQPSRRKGQNWIGCAGKVTLDIEQAPIIPKAETADSAQEVPAEVPQNK